VHEPLPAVSVTAPADDVASSQSKVQVCVSWVPTSVKSALTVALPPRAIGLTGPVTPVICGARLFTVTLVAALSLPPSSSVAVTVIGLTSDLVAVGLSSR
jgi:hypothetical protein